ncbi:four-carbon acid sugar kinase family protein [Mesorhizobium sp.]|uniref:four-carbon acid sugar kinase family protein n=1 Tax=Mesorhizobium sp. TaxID=1871066 RepID=UPI000FEA3957|nr:four-carbon acid sugar kinase family protein [Mesorhizobium sp.]RWM47243.1 MAG: four-carbon acid sugar kinase family protein [Mesorhizobium sp.]RWM48298.1 MAG: four-carbon acid sugar kinase family protein [Mesorhizobium sp.]RWM53033.1 MAG: four-carbon acid sugar kinase family protein [Mesorhizobium sp.]TIO65170.1 MAG: four-carbon acid sugar kinase family protein [Mesorhizobium sp.]TJV89666.1 MAG: four-carbon acid sugar kinase family protein [Mesorhizobium sp.]
MRTNGQHTVGILADDLTSAADGAGPFVERGLRAVVGRGCLPEEEVTIVAVDSGSRSATASHAAELTAKLAAQLASRDVLYKTVDSTLRGHVRAELEAAFKASGRKMLVFAPAFPAAGRTTVSGVQLVDGVPVTETAYGRDPVHPARHSRLVDLVPASVSNVVILDAATQDDLDTQLAALPDPESILWVGSPGMAVALAKRLALVAAVSDATVAARGDILIAIGSANPLSHRQADQVAAETGVTLLRAPAQRADDPVFVLRGIAQDAAGQLRDKRFDAVIATGGDTVEAILDHLGIRAFEILQEFEPGFPLGRALLGDGHELLVAMKAGGFGDDDTLRRAIARLRQNPSVPGQVS